jgi:hypothetical protein
VKLFLKFYRYLWPSSDDFMELEPGLDYRRKADFRFERVIDLDAHWDGPGA